MTDTLELHTYTAEVVSPVHIGAGETLLPIDFVVHKGRLHVVNLEKLIESIPFDQIEAFSNMLIQTKDMAQVFQWLRISPFDYGKYAKYSVPCHVQPSELRVFVKNAFEEPYMPGSSIKGALRTAMCYNLFNNPQSKKWLVSEIYHILGRFRDRKKASKALQNFVESTFGKEQGKHSPHYDVMRFLRISDTENVDVDQLKVQKVNMIRTSGFGRYEELKLKMYVETMVPGLVMSGKITIDKTLSQEVYAAYKGLFSRFDVSTNMGTVISYANKFAADLIDYEIGFASSYGVEKLRRFYANLKQNVLQKLGENQFLLRLGWGSGFFATTISMLLKDDRVFSEIRRLFPKLGNFRTPVFPMSRRIVFSGEEMVPLGWVKFTVV